MTRIRIESSWPETTWWKVTFTNQGGTFTPQQLREVKEATNNLAGFDGRNAAIMSLVYDSSLYLRPAKQAFEALQRIIPDAQFETRDVNLRQYLGDEVVLL